jgi:ribosomal protein S10
MSQKIRIKLKSYDHNLVDKSAEKIQYFVHPLLIRKQENSSSCHLIKGCSTFTAQHRKPSMH